MSTETHQKVLVTGGAGFMGSNYVHYAIKVSPKRPQALRFLVGDDSQLEIM